MGLRSGFGRHPVLGSLGGGLLLLVLVALAGGWYALGEERRTGHLLSRLLSRQLGVPVRVERARAEPSRLTLRGVSVPPGEHWGGSLEIRELRVEGGVLPVVLPRGRAVSVVAVSTSVTLAGESAPLSAPPPDTLTAIRRAVLRFLEWPAALSLEMKGGELRSGAATLAFDLRGEKAEDGKLALRLGLGQAKAPPAVAIETLGAAAGQNVRLAIRAEGDPRGLGAFWPSSLPVPGRFAAQVDLTLSAPAGIELTGRLVATPAGGESPEALTARFAARYRADQQRVDLSELAVEWGPALRLDLTGSADGLDEAARLTVKMSGSVDGSRLTGDATYSALPGVLRAQLVLQPFVAGPLMERLGYPSPTVEVRARRAGLTLEGRTEGKDRVRVEGGLRLEDVEASPRPIRAPLRAAIRFAGTVTRGEQGISITRLDAGELSLASPAGAIGLVAARTQSRSGGITGPWPLAVEVRIPDLSRLPPLEAVPLRLSGEARVDGSLDWTRGAPVFAGHLAVRVPRGEADVGGPLVVSNLQASLPLAWGGIQEPAPGTIAAESLTAFGFILHRLGSPARMKGGTLSLPEITYVHYGGSGKGWAEAELAGAAVPLRMRLEGEGVDLARLTTEYGLTVGRITGRVRYVLALQYSQAGGLAARGQVVSDPPGGEVNIDALRKLLTYAEADPTGILKQTLETLSVFFYESLTGDIRVGPQGGRVSLSLEGKKRLGLFPGRVQAINLQNIPLALLVKTFSQPRRDSP